MNLILNKLRTLRKILKLKKLFGKRNIRCDSIDIPGEVEIYNAEGFIFGDGIYIGPRAFIDARGGVEFGDNIILAPHVMIFSYNHDYKDENWTPYGPGIIKRAVLVGNNVWIGAAAILTPGCTIGNNCVIGSGSVVRGLIPSNSIVAGNPAVVISNMPQKSKTAMQYQVVMSKKKRWG